ncbi:hypothetical protein [Bacillus infantis]|uniref:hypothetical protein n=1 Tax=Bacillus infantis TaxID=324767 RepID=UPI0021CCB7DA|nr:hypothetical protein [Bacillus infantis]
MDLGTDNGKEVQEAIEYVSNLTAENRLPDKMVIVHQFAENVLFNNDSTHPTDNTEVVINFDGYRLDAIKSVGYNEFVQEQPIQYGGFKVFYKKDVPFMT